MLLVVNDGGGDDDDPVNLLVFIIYTHKFKM